MARYDFTTRRLFVDAPLAKGASVELDRAQAHYLRDVLRLSEGAQLLIFNGKDGEWRAALNLAGRKSARLEALELTRPQEKASDLHYVFAPLKQARQDYMVQKAVEMGAGLLQPVLTRHTHAERVNEARMRANAIEAAQQCGILTLPDIAPPLAFDRLIAERDPARLLVFCDEDAEVKDPVAALADARREAGGAPPLAVLIGPEGGFAAAERALLIGLPKVVRLALGPRILRADTAAVAALALVQAVLGDWR